MASRYLCNFRFMSTFVCSSLESKAFQNFTILSELLTQMNIFMVNLCERKIN